MPCDCANKLKAAAIMWRGVLIALLSTLSCVHSSCYIAGVPPRLDDSTEENSCLDSYSGERLAMNESRVTSMCYNCTCSPDFLSCCGVGIRSGQIGPPPGHTVVEDPDCGYHFEPLTIDEVPRP